jgi:molybdate transport system substrate-binding protein
MPSRLARTLTILAIVAIVITGCGATPTPTATPSAPPSPAGTAAPTKAPGAVSSPEPLVIFAGSAGKPPLDEAARLFRSRTGIPVEVTYGGSGTVLSQMILARTGDLYIPGSQDFMDVAETKQAVDPATRSILAYLIPAIAVQKGNPLGINSLQNLARPGLRVGLGNLETVCLGVFGKEILQTAGLWDQVSPNIVVYTKSCDDTATVLALGQVDVVIGWDVFDKWQPDKITVIPLPAKQVVKIGNIPVAIPSYSHNRGVAQEFIELLTSAEGKAIFARNGYLVNAP